MRIDVRPYRDLAPTELEEWKRLAKKAHPPGEVRLGSDLRWAGLDQRPTTSSDCGMKTSCVHARPAQRRRGYGRTVMEHAQELMRSLANVEFALLFSSVMAVPFYETLGWRTIPGPVTCDQRPHPLHRGATDRSRNGAPATAIGEFAGWWRRSARPPMVRARSCRTVTAKTRLPVRGR